MRLSAAFLAALGVITFVGGCVWLWGPWAAFTAGLVLVGAARGAVEMARRQRKEAKK